MSPACSTPCHYMLLHATPHYATPHHVMPRHHVMPHHHVMPRHHIMPCRHITPSLHVTLGHSMPLHAMPRHAMPLHAKGRGGRWKGEGDGTERGGGAGTGGKGVIFFFERAWKAKQKYVFLLENWPCYQCLKCTPCQSFKNTLKCQNLVCATSKVPN